MTDAEINRAIHEALEGKCVHKWGQTEFGKWFCNKCEITCETVGHFPIKHIPNYLENDVYIFGLQLSLVKAGYHLMYFKMLEKYGVRMVTDDYETTLATDKCPSRAILLAALKKAEQDTPEARVRRMKAEAEFMWEGPDE